MFIYRLATKIIWEITQIKAPKEKFYIPKFTEFHKETLQKEKFYMPKFTEF